VAIMTSAPAGNMSESLGEVIIREVFHRLQFLPISIVLSIFLIHEWNGRKQFQWFSDNSFQIVHIDDIFQSDTSRSLVPKTLNQYNAFKRE
jgi:hypothetical protein